MEQNIDHKIEFKNKLINIYNSNKIKIYLIACITVLSVISLFIFKEINEKKNNLMSEKYIMAGLKINSGKKKEGANLLEEIILSKNKFYSILALNTIIEKKLILDKSKILEYFDILQNRVSSKSSYDLIILKKALYLMNEMELQKGKDLLKNLEINNSSLKSIAKELLKN